MRESGGKATRKVLRPCPVLWFRTLVGGSSLKDKDKPPTNTVGDFRNHLYDHAVGGPTH